jgi:hypothetical protein
MASPAEMQGARLREAAQLFRAGDINATATSVSEDRMDSLLRIGAYESAAIELLEDSAGFMLSRGLMGKCMATVVLETPSEEIAVDGATPALAMLAATAAAQISRLATVANSLERGARRREGAG